MTDARELIHSDLSVSLLYKIMDKLGNIRHIPPKNIWTTLFLELVSPELDFGDEGARSWYVNRHLNYLEEEGYIRIEMKPLDSMYGKMSLTSQGEDFVQPDLLEFGRASIFPQIVKLLEERVQVLSYPEEEKSGLLYRLRDSIAHEAPDLIAKVIVEIGSKIITGGSTSH